MLSYRFINDSDIGTVSAIMLDSLHSREKSDLEADDVQVFMHGELHKKIGRDGLHGLIASHDNRPVGFIIWQNGFDAADLQRAVPLATVDRLYTVPSDQHTGTNLMRKMINMIEPHRQVRVFSSSSAKRQYRHWGFIDVSRNQESMPEMRLSVYRANQWRITAGKKPPRFIMPEPATFLPAAPF